MSNIGDILSRIVFVAGCIALVLLIAALVFIRRKRS